MMLFQIESDRFESAYADFLERIQNAMQQTYAEEKEARSLTKTAIAETLDVDLSVVSRRLNGGGNITLRTISDMYTAMGREPLSNFVPPRSRVTEDNISHQPSMPSQHPEQAAAMVNVNATLGMPPGYGVNHPTNASIERPPNLSANPPLSYSNVAVSAIYGQLGSGVVDHQSVYEIAHRGIRRADISLDLRSQKPALEAVQPPWQHAGPHQADIRNHTSVQSRVADFAGVI